MYCSVFVVVVVVVVVVVLVVSCVMLFVVYNPRLPFRTVLSVVVLVGVRDLL